jgi:hypothetical protein
VSTPWALNGEQWPSRLVATAAEDRLNYRPTQRSRFRGEMRLNLFRMATGDKIIDRLSLPPSAVKSLAEAEAQRPKKALKGFQR